MAKNNNITVTEGKTVEQLMQELKVAVDKHNASESASERVKLKVDIEKLKTDYNLASLHKAYAECMEAKLPILELVNRYTYKVVSVSTKRDTGDYSIKTDGTAVFNLWDFVGYAEGRNKQVTTALDWKTRASEARTALLKQIRAFNEEGTPLLPGDFKIAVQKMFDSVLMIPGKSGKKNAVVISSQNIRMIQSSCGKMNYKTLVASYADDKTWMSQMFALLHLSVKGKQFTALYGEEANPTTDDETTEETKAEAKTEAKPAKDKTETKTK